MLNLNTLKCKVTNVTTSFIRNTYKCELGRSYGTSLISSILSLQKMDLFISGYFKLYDDDIYVPLDVINILCKMYQTRIIHLLDWDTSNHISISLERILY